MAQIKWAWAPWDPESPAQNPPRGNGTLSVSMPARGTADPAAAVDAAGGDFLFRVEVHDVQWSSTDPTQPGRLVIKWSRENGAEAHRALEAPSSFKAGQWVYEVFKQENDLHLGYQWWTWRPTRGQLIAGFPLLNPQTSGDSLVRRWDGSCVLYRNGNSWGFSPNAPEDPAKTAPGAAITLDGSPNARLNVRLIDLEFTLDLQGKVFLPGDSWQVPVRRAIHQPGDRILQAATPSGIAHRYVKLADVNATGDVTPALRTFSALSELEAADIRYDGSGCQSGLYGASHDTVKKALDRLWQLGAEHAAYTKPADTSVYQGKTVANVKEALNLLGDVRARQIAFEGRTGVPNTQAAIDELFTRANGDANGFTVGGSGAEFPNVVTALQTLLTQGRRDIRLVLLPGDHELDTTIVFAPNATAPTHLTLTGSGWTSRLLVRRPTTFLDFSSITFQALAIEFNADAWLELWNSEVNLLDNRIAGSSKDGLFRPVNSSRLLVRDNVVEVTVQDPTADPVAILTPLDTDATVRELFSTRLPRLFNVRAQAIVDKLRALSTTQRAQRVLSIETNLERNPGDFQRGPYNDLVANIRQGGGPDARALPLLAAIRQQAVQWAQPGVFLQNRLPGYPIRLESNQIFGTVSLYGPPGADLSGSDLSTIAGRLAGGVGFDPGAAFELVATGNRMSGFVVSPDILNALRSTTPIMPLFQRMALSDNTFDSVLNQITAVNVELNGNLFTATSAGWIVAEEIVLIGNVARNDVALDVVTRNLVQAGNSAHLRVRPAAPAPPK
jgi:hypothetical protein